MTLALFVIIWCKVSLSMRVEEKVITKRRNLYFTRFDSPQVLGNEKQSLSRFAKLLFKVLILRILIFFKEILVE